MPLHARLMNAVFNHYATRRIEQAKLLAAVNPSVQSLEQTDYIDTPPFTLRLPEIDEEAVNTVFRIHPPSERALQQATELRERLRQHQEIAAEILYKSAGSKGVELSLNLIDAQTGETLFSTPAVTNLDDDFSSHDFDHMFALTAPKISGLFGEAIHCSFHWALQQDLPEDRDRFDGPHPYFTGRIPLDIFLSSREIALAIRTQMTAFFRENPAAKSLKAFFLTSKASLGKAISDYYKNNYAIGKPTMPEGIPIFSLTMKPDTVKLITNELSKTIKPYAHLIPIQSFLSNPFLMLSDISPQSCLKAPLIEALE